jgi:undecaprenyl diphosphate synthase
MSSARPKRPRSWKSSVASIQDEGPSESTLTRVPRHVAIIMDGNGRWARARGLPRLAGHRAGTENLRRILQAAVEFGIEVLTVYAFSTENWSRPAHEVNALMRLLESSLDSELDALQRNGVCVRHVGRTEGLPSRLANKIRQAEELTKGNSRLTLCVALNYGGRAEIIDAVREIVSEGLAPEEITEETLSQHLYTAGLPDPDLIIRTGGDVRLSNFLLWQASYAELYGTPVYWPDFDGEQLHAALLDYAARQRRFGGLPQNQAPGT